jgi:anhydro-N-acetylmuramic acid kinase
MPLAIGMNSGSSFDGIDAVLVDLDIGADGQPTPPEVLDGLTYDWPEEVRRPVLKAFAGELGIFELTRLHYTVGAVYAQAARKLMDEQGLAPDQVDVVGVDGQTIYQEPPDREAMAAHEGDLISRWLDGPWPCGLQIGEPAIIAAHCGIPVVWNFRPSDHALGGTGAPLMQYLDWVAFRSRAPLLTLNIGGIANCQLVQPDRAHMMAFDTGPGNVMVDHAMRTGRGAGYDRDGATAAAGRVDEGMLAEMQGHPFFDRQPPRSAWRLDFGADYADGMMERYRQLPFEDVVATFTAFSAWAIATSLRRHIPDLDRIDLLVASGGGVRNRTLLDMLEQRLPPHLRLTLSDELGIPAQFKEAVKFATLGFAARRRLANNIPAASGADRFTVMGKLVEPPGVARLQVEGW